LQAAGVVLYIALVSGVMRLVETSSMDRAPIFMGVVAMLLLFVFSAGVTSTLVFGYPVYLVFQKQWKEALTVLAYTFAYLFVTGLALFGSLFLFWS
jgi:hypothetical protein